MAETESGGETISSDTLRKEASGLTEVKAGDVVKRIWGDGFMITEMRVEKTDETFIYCDAQRDQGEAHWAVLPGDSVRWKFDLEYGVETDEDMDWGVIPYATKGIILSRIIPMEAK